MSNTGKITQSLSNSADKMLNTFVFSFNMHGFESIINLTSVDEQYLLDKLAGDSSFRSVNLILRNMHLRCQLNSHRNPEMWLLNLPDHLTEDILWKAAIRDPQGLVNMVRKVGECMI